MSAWQPGNVFTAQITDELAPCLKGSPNTLVVVHAHADWAPECVHMNEVLTEIAAKFPYVCCVKLNAEEADDFVDKHNISAVPCFLFFKNQQVIDRLDGANAPELTAKVKKHTEAIPTPVVAAPKVDLDTRMKQLIGQSPCVVFMKGSRDNPRCKFSRQIIGILDRHNADYTTFDILGDENVRQGLKKLSDWPTYPQVYINKEFVGGVDIVAEMDQNGELATLLPKKKDLDARLKELVGRAPVMLFMKGSPTEPRCGFSRKVVALLDSTGVPYSTFDILTDMEVREGLKKLSDWPTYPQLYVKGELVGGLDILQELQDNGSLLETLQVE